MRRELVFLVVLVVGLVFVLAMTITLLGFGQAEALPGFLCGGFVVALIGLFLWLNH